MKELQARQAKDREASVPASSVGEVGESRGATVLERLKGMSSLQRILAIETKSQLFLLRTSCRCDEDCSIHLPCTIAS